ncbi:hypothetical protein U1Q18_005143 [Sarracenia purpurea var. burkii]
MSWISSSASESTLYRAIGSLVYLVVGLMRAGHQIGHDWASGSAPLNWLLKFAEPTDPDAESGLAGLRRSDSSLSWPSSVVDDLLKIKSTPGAPPTPPLAPESPCSAQGIAPARHGEKMYAIGVEEDLLPWACAVAGKVQRRCGYPTTHDFLRPLDGLGKKSAREENTAEITAIENPPPPAPPSSEHLLPGGIGTYSISHIPYFDQRVLKPEGAIFAVAQASSADRNETSSNCSSYTGSGFTLWEESTVMKGKTGKENAAVDRHVARDQGWLMARHDNIDSRCENNEEATTDQWPKAITREDIEARSPITALWHPIACSLKFRFECCENLGSGKTLFSGGSSGDRRHSLSGSAVIGVTETRVKIGGGGQWTTSERPSQSSSNNIATTTTTNHHRNANTTFSSLSSSQLVVFSLIFINFLSPLSLFM